MTAAIQAMIDKQPRCLFCNQIAFYENADKSEHACKKHVPVEQTNGIWDIKKGWKESRVVR